MARQVSIFTLIFSRRYRPLVEVINASSLCRPVQVAQQAADDLVPALTYALAGLNTFINLIVSRQIRTGHWPAFLLGWYKIISY